MNLFGFFQSERFFEDYAELILQLLTPTVGPSLPSGITAIHKRFFVPEHNSANSIPGVNYYKQAIELLNCKQCLVFSDKINLAQEVFTAENFPGINISFSKGLTRSEDLGCMSRCDNVIIAASTFSWWGAWLCRNPQKKIVSPTPWYQPGTWPDTKDLIPASWIQLPACQGT
jgi:hypothetical protein